MSWFFPLNVSLSATPNALTLMTEMEPTSEQMERYTSGVLRPYAGTTFQIITVEKTPTNAQ